MSSQPHDLAAFVAANPPRPGFTAARMIDAWEDLASLADVQAIATDDRGERSAVEDGAATHRQLAAAVRWVQAHHGREVADAFVTYLGDASSGRGPDAPYGCT